MAKKETTDLENALLLQWMKDTKELMHDTNQGVKSLTEGFHDMKLQIRGIELEHEDCIGKRAMNEIEKYRKPLDTMRMAFSYPKTAILVFTILITVSFGSIIVFWSKAKDIKQEVIQELLHKHKITDINNGGE